MKIKTFYAKTMAEALQSIKLELGSDALILSTKEIPRRAGLGFRKKTGFEVVAATDGTTDSGSTTSTFSGRVGNDTGSARARASSGKVRETGTDTPIYTTERLIESKDLEKRRPRVGGECNEMHRALYSFIRPDVPSTSLFDDAVAYELYYNLISNDVNEWLAYKLLDEAQRGLSSEKRRDRSALFRSVTTVARGLVRASSFQNGMPTKRVVVFLGPTGGGKTTTIAKLAATLALQKKRVVLMTLDGFRIGAVEQLRTYAGLMGVPFRFVSQVSELSQAIQDHCQRDYILIDTTGRGPRDLDAMRDLVDFLEKSSQTERHLVLSATTKSGDMHEAVDRFSICNPDHLLFTKLDETSTFGPIFNELVRTQKPVSYFTDGQKVPEDLHAMPMERIIDIVLNAN